MSLMWKIYLSGYLVSVIICLCIFRDEKNRIDVGEFLMSLLLSVFSWLSVFALWVGQNIKRAKAEWDKNENSNLK